MQLSVIIVNYNVKHFLEQCLFSVEKALKGTSGEIIVVDNNSVDGSVGMLREYGDKIKLIENKTNAGFSKANNQAIKIAKGKLILLLNPDTVIQEDTLKNSIRFFTNHPEAGAMGTKMIDGNGHFLPESKRGLPTPAVSFYKITGLSRLFPKSRKFNQYHLGYLDMNETHEVEILSGAFIMLRKEVLDKIGLLDESFFMYGEDIDLSYRVIKAGYKNFYFAGTTIIHYKGESTKKGSLNYVYIFYKAMELFARKHFNNRHASLFNYIIQFAIWTRAGLSMIKRIIHTLLLPSLDLGVLILNMAIVKTAWTYLKLESSIFPPRISSTLTLLYLLLWVGSLFFSGAYDKPLKIKKAIKGVLTSTIIIILVYSLLPEDWRFSRAFIFLSTITGILGTTINRLLLNQVFRNRYVFLKQQHKRIAIIGEIQEGLRIENIIRQSHKKPEYIGFVAPDENLQKVYIGTISQLEQICSVNKINEIIFCAKDVKSEEIIQKMVALAHQKVQYKIAPPESFTIIGSSSLNNNGELYEISINSITKASNSRSKRLLDIFLAIILLITSPAYIWCNSSVLQAYNNLLQVLGGKKSFVGYIFMDDNKYKQLPSIRTGILTPLCLIEGSKQNVDSNLIGRLNWQYAKEYSIINDIRIVKKGLCTLDGKIKK